MIPITTICPKCGEEFTTFTYLTDADIDMVNYDLCPYCDKIELDDEAFEER